jgi:hypothetical protein
MGIKNLIMLVIISSLMLAAGCSKRDQIDTTEEKDRILRESLGIQSITKWNNEIKNQVQIFDRQGRIIEERWYNPDEVLVTSRVLKYKSRSNKPEEVIWYKGDSIKKSRYLYTYDRNNNLIEEEWLSPREQTQIKIEYFYGDFGLEKQIRYGSNENLIHTRHYEYKNGNLIEFKEINSRDNITNRHEYYYNEKGNRYLEKWFNPEGEIRTIRHYLYDNDLLIGKKQYRNADEFEYKVDYHYDDNGMLIGEFWYNEEGDMFFSNEYSFEYHN